MKRTPLEAWIGAKIGLSGDTVRRADLEVYQGQALAATVAWVRARSRFYRQRLAQTPEITGLADLRLLPFTTAADLRAEPLQLVCVSQDDIQRVVTLDTSGTTGSQKRLYFTRDDQELTIDFFQHGMTTFTDPGDRVLILLPGQTPGSVGDLLATALRRFDAVAVKYGAVTDPEAVLDVIRREAISVIVGVPVHLLALVRTEPKLRLKSVLFATDHAPDPIRAALEHQWGCATFDHYGMTEMGLGGGVECEAQRGYHLREADLLFEIVDPLTGEAQPDGSYGEIVFTTLTRRGMPLIRYRTGDYGRFIPGDCPCGTSLKTLERVAARLSGRIPIGDGVLTIAALDQAVFGCEQVLHYSAALTRTAQGDCLRLHVQMTEVSADPAAVLQAIKQALTLPAALELQVMVADHIPLTMAKRVLVDRRAVDHD